MQYTKEQLVETIKKNRCNSVTALWKSLGHTSKIGGKDSKKIREILGDSVSLFTELPDTSAETVAAVVAAPVVEAVALAPVTPVVEAAPAAEAAAPITSDAAEASTPAEKIETDIQYREGSLVGTIYREGVKGFKDKDAFIQKIVEMTGKTFDNVKYHVSVIACQRSNPQSPNNRGTKLVQEDGTFYIVASSDPRPTPMEVKKAAKLVAKQAKATARAARADRKAKKVKIMAEKEIAHKARKYRIANTLAAKQAKLVARLAKVEAKLKKANQAVEKITLA